MKKMKTLILAICAMLALGANAKTELTTVQGDHGKLDVKIQTPDDHGFSKQEEKSAHIASDFLAKVLK